MTIPEWVFDLDGPGHYMRRLKNVSLSIPSITGPYTSVSCTLSLLKSSLRKSPLLADGEYPRQGSEDTRFVDYYGTIQQIVTSSGNNDSGLFETNLRDERFLPFEGAGAESKWKLELPASFRQFEYNTISDVILHIRYTARQGGSLLGGKAAEYLEELVSEANAAGLALLFSLKHDFPSEWHKFVVANADSPSPSVFFSAKVKRDHFPYFTQGMAVSINALQRYRIIDDELKSVTDDVPADFADALNNPQTGVFELLLSPDQDEVLAPDKQANVFMLIKYSLESA